MKKTITVHNENDELRKLQSLDDEGVMWRTLVDRPLDYQPSKRVFFEGFPYELYINENCELTWGYPNE